MANVMSGYDEEGIRDVLYDRPDRLMESYLDDRLNDDRIGGRYSERFLERARTIRKRLSDSRAYRATLAATRRLKNRGRLDRIEQLLDIGGLQHAPRSMQRFIMANRVVRNAWRKRQAEGYRDDYDDGHTNRNAVGHTHDVYRQVMNGIVRKEDDGYWASSYYMTQDEREELTTADIADIRITWAEVEKAMWEMADDPTSQYNASL